MATRTHNNQTGKIQIEGNQEKKERERKRRKGEGVSDMMGMAWDKKVVLSTHSTQQSNTSGNKESLTYLTGVNSEILFCQTGLFF